MNILFLSQVLPYPLDAGPKMRSYYVLQHLAKKHRVTLLAFVRDNDRPEYIAHLAEFCEAVHTIPMRRHILRDLFFLTKSMLLGQSFIIIRDELAAMNDALRAIMTKNNFDAVHADQLWMAQYALRAKYFSPKVKLILDQHNAVHLIPQRLAEGENNWLKRIILAREAKVMAKFEAETCARFDDVVWVTAEDRRAVDAISSQTISTDAIIPICANPADATGIPLDDASQRITFLGGLHWMPNAQGIVWFAQKVLPKIRAVCPNARLTVIGKNPPAQLEGLAGVETTGYVPELTQYLTDTKVFVVPLHAGGGMRVKILDAWCWGLPIVSTTIGAEGITVRHGEDILIADTPDDFAQAVISLLQSPNLAKQLALNGRRTIENKYNWQQTYAAWDKIYDEK